jgi:hypothetical protein
MQHFDDVYRQLNIQMKRLAHIQRLVDILASKVNELIMTADFER